VLKELGLEWRDIKVILLTHGHIDHTGNLARISNSPVLRYSLTLRSSLIINGTFALPWRQPLWCGALEAAGRWLLRYQACGH